MPTIHKVPSGAEIDSNGDHVRVERREVSDDIVRLHCTWGTVNSDGDFVKREYAQHPPVEIQGDDRTALTEDATDHTAPDVKGDSLQYAETDILSFLDNNSLWPTQ